MEENWKGIYGQNQVLNTLEKFFISDRVSHAYMFYGPQGSGKHITALRFAGLLNSATKTGGKDFSKKISALEEPYIKYIFPLPRGKGETPEDTPTGKLSPDQIKDLNSHLKTKSENPYYNFRLEKASSIKINSIRDLKRFISLNYSDLNYRTIIISDAHLMNAEAQNALLKSLEEPPEGVVFILLTSHPDQLLETIRSRSWQVKFAPLKEEDVKNILINYFKVDEPIAAKAALFSNGSVTHAIELLENNFEELLEKTIFILRYALVGRYNSALSEINDFSKSNNANALKLIIQMIIKWLNDVIKDKVHFEKFYFIDFQDTMKKFNEKFPEADIEKLVGKLNELSASIDKNVSLNLIALNIIFEIGCLQNRT